MKKFIAGITLSLCSLGSYADSFNYSDIATCKIAMENYASKAKKLGDASVSDEGFFRFYSMSKFFDNLEMASSKKTECANHECVMDIPASCSLVTTSQTWNKVIPYLNKEVNQYLNTASYDPAIPQGFKLIAHCRYHEGNENYENCEITS